MINRSTLLKDSLGALLVRGAGIVLMFGSTTLAARVLGAEVYGTFAASLSLAMLLAALTPLGTDRVLANRLSILSDQQHRANEIAATLHGSVLIASLLLTIMLGVWSAGKFVQTPSDWLSMLLSSSLMFVPLAMLYLRQWIAIPLIGARRAMLSDQIVLPLVFSSLLVFVDSQHFQSSPMITAGLYVVSIIVALGFSFRTGPLRNLYIRSVRLVCQSSLHTVRVKLTEGLPFVTVSIGGVISQTCMPLLTALTCGFQESAYFALAAPFAAIPLIPLGVFNLSLIPVCSRHFQEGRVQDVEHILRNAATATFYSSIGLGVCVWLCSPLLTIILGTEFRAVTGLLPALLLAAMMDCLTGPTVPVMQSMGMERFYSRAMLIFVLCQLILVSLAGQLGGVEAVAGAYLIGRCVWNITVGWKIYQVLGLRMLPYLNVRHLLRAKARVRGQDITEDTGVPVSGSHIPGSPVGYEARAA